MLTKNSHVFTIECDNYVTFHFKEKVFGSTIELSVGHASLSSLREDCDAIESSMSVSDYCDFANIILDIEDAMSYYLRDLYTSSYISMMQSLVDGYDGGKDKESGSPWCTSYFYDIEDPSFISDCAKKDALSDCEEIAGYIDEEEDNLGHNSVFYITLNAGNKYKEYEVEKKIVCKEGKDYQKTYTYLALECEALKSVGHSYFIDTTLLDRVKITAAFFDDVLEDIEKSTDPDLYAASYALDSLDKSEEIYTEDGISYHLDYLLEHGASFDKIAASLIAENFVGLR